MSTANYNALAGTPLTRGRVVPDVTSLPSGNTVTADVMCVGDDTLMVMVDMNGTAAGDLAVEVRPYEADNVTVQVNQIPPVQSDGPDLNAGRVTFMGRFDVSALERVQIRITNNNAGAMFINRAGWRLA